MNTRIVIPIYKKTLSKSEKQSIEQCFKILCDYPVSIVTHKELDTTEYCLAAQKVNVTPVMEYFDKRYFASTTSYNRLLLSKDFYLRFADDDYILIYQLDGFVFRDELADWCSKGFDYIGAPWFEHYGRDKWAKSLKLYRVGNGGVSLRKVAAFLDRFDKPMPLSIIPFYVKNIRKKGMITMMFKLLKMMFLLLLTNRTIEYYLQYFTDERVQEDCFWSDGLSDTSLAFDIPDIMTAASFCMERHPSYLYRQTGERLPFACHAYEKYEYEEFWGKYIS
ncbi:MAG: hypothetical protein LBC98_07060 [Prevotellaceae bacterium]|jgi:hypothetical protein|nr:hypothetical protein [Prevotellaceae bacterium]